jgi:hypothetical protein
MWNTTKTLLGMDISYRESTIYIVTTVDLPWAADIASRKCRAVYKSSDNVAEKMVVHVRTNDD